LPIAQKYGLAVIPWSPLAGGWLTGKFRAGGAQPASSRAGRQPGRFEIDAPENATKLAAVEALAELAEQSGLSLVHLALGFVLEHPAVTAPIIRPRPGLPTAGARRPGPTPPEHRMSDCTEPRRAGAADGLDSEGHEHMRKV